MQEFIVGDKVLFELASMGVIQFLLQPKNNAVVVA